MNMIYVYILQEYPPTADKQTSLRSAISQLITIQKVHQWEAFCIFNYYICGMHNFA